MLAMGFILSINGGTSGIFTRDLGSPSGLRPSPTPPKLPEPRGLQFPASTLEFSNSHRGRSAARIGCLGGAAPPAPPSPPTLLSTHPCGSGVFGLAWWPHLFPIWACALRPLLRVVPRVGAFATVSPIHFFRPQPEPSRRAASLCLRPSPTLWVFLCLGGAASANLLRLGGTPAPYPTSSIRVCLGSPLLRSLASSPFIRCHGHDQRLERGGSRIGVPSAIRFPKGRASGRSLMLVLVRGHSNPL